MQIESLYKLCLLRDGWHLVLGHLVCLRDGIEEFALQLLKEIYDVA